jgi:hypothetical protein
MCSIITGSFTLEAWRTAGAGRLDGCHLVLALAGALERIHH